MNNKKDERVIVYNYYSFTVYSSKEKAIQKFKKAALCSEGSEQNRYCEILVDLTLSSKNLASDKIYFNSSLEDICENHSLASIEEILKLLDKKNIKYIIKED